MAKMIRLVGTLVLLLSFGYVLNTSYLYFFSRKTPTINIEGIDQSKWYRGEISYSVIAQDPFRVSSVKVSIDGKVLENIKAYGKSFTYKAKLNTKELNDGLHTIEVEVLNGLYSKLSSVSKLNLNVDNKPISASFVPENAELKVLQGRTLHVKFQVNKPMKNAYAELFNTKYLCYPEIDNSLIYEAFIPISCEEQLERQILKVALEDQTGSTMHLDMPVQVVASQFKRQQIRVDADRVKKEKENALDDNQLEQDLQTLIAYSPAKKLWKGSFYLPLEMQRITTDYGTVRVTPEKGKYIHKAVDLIGAAPRSVIWAPQDGKVVIKNKYGMSGNTVVLDHGCGIFSLFFHLDDFASGITLGKFIKKGNPIGKSGSTGYASGDHLHWEMRINNIPVDPMQWVSQNF